MKNSMLRMPDSGGYAHGWNRTEVSRPVAVCLSVVFCAGLLVVPLVDGFLGSWRSPFLKLKEGAVRLLHVPAAHTPFLSAAAQANNSALAAIKKFETSLEDSSAIGAALRPSVLDRLLTFGAAGSEEAYIGRDGWLFYRPDVDALVMSQPRTGGAARGIAKFAVELAERGIRLVVVPVPGKASIHPEKLASEGAVFASAPVPAVLSGLSENVAAAWREEADAEPSMEPVIVDATDLLWRAKCDGNQDQFLRTDSHWTPAAMRSTARMTAAALGSTGISLPAEKMTSRKRAVSAAGDTALMHVLPGDSFWLRPQNVEIEAVFAEDGAAWRPDRSSPVLVLGDSYTNIYSAEDLGWGGDAGFAEQLSLALGGRVDKLAQNNAGAKSAREMLAAEAGRRPGWLDGKKIVVWVMAAREFVRGDWSDVELGGAPHADDTRFFVVPPGRTVEVRARVVSHGNVPASGESPYADYLTAIHLADIEDAASGRKIPGDALAYIFSMRDRQPVALPELSGTHRIRLRLSNYAEKADKLDSLNRGDLENTEVMMEEPNFAECIAPQ